ncbi:MAG: helix-turn-helix domain-containing protein [Rhodococcus sp. (in: high G+C Gram-positive bacteria)]|uniref:sigma-54-dependent Fis family transcriptional regulator n=1 Tax=Rhodococcus sp. TaxID=1831 RepID=UPI003BB5FD75
MGELDPSLRPLIAQSWQRVAMSGLYPQASVDNAEIDDVDRRSRLMVAAAPILDEMAEELADTGFAVILADRTARLVDLRFGQRQLQPRLENIGTVEGRRFLEETTGTNSIATAFELRRGLAVRGDEHYIDALKDFSCYGEPILNPITRRVEGVLDITCLTRDDSPLLAPFVIRAAHRIGDGLLEQARRAEQRIFRSFQDATARARTRPVVAIGDDILLANTPAVQMLEPADHVLLRTLAVEVPAGRDVRREISSAVGRLLSATVTRIPGSSAALFVFDGDAAPRPTQVPHTAVRTAPRARVITGEPGTGRTTTARRLSDEAATWLDASQAAELGSRSWLETLRRHLAEPGRVVVESIELLSASSARSTAAAIRAGRADVVLTSAPAEELPAEHAALVAHCSDRIDLAPLRLRRTDIPSLAASMLNELTHPAPARFTPAALEALTGQQWPGNLRELHTVVAVVAGKRSSGDVTVADLPEAMRTRMVRALTPLEQAERDAVAKALHDTGGNKKAAAQRLGISRTTLYRAIRSYGLAPSQR